MSLLDGAELQEAIPWDPEAEGVCGTCGGEGQVQLFTWTPFGHLPLPAELCIKCEGTGRVEPLSPET